MNTKQHNNIQQPKKAEQMEGYTNIDETKLETSDGSVRSYSNKLYTGK